MRLSSVKAVVRFRGNDREQLSLPARERRRPEHDRGVELHRRIHRRGVLAHYVDDVPDSTRAFERLIEELLEKAGSLPHRDLFDVGHGGT